MTTRGHPPPDRLRRKSGRQPTPPSDFFKHSLGKYRDPRQKSTVGPRVQGEPSGDFRLAQLTAIVSDPSSSHDNREAAAHDLFLEFPDFQNFHLNPEL
jgi:hypothetical protein